MGSPTQILGNFGHVFKYVIIYLLVRRITLMHEARVNKRLSRLVKCGIRSTENSSKYANELKQLADEISEESVSTKSKFFKALADETRLKILKLLQTREMCVCEIMVALNLTQPTASHHLGLLENVGLIKDRKDGKWVFYSISDPKLIDNMQKFGIL